MILGTRPFLPTALRALALEQHGALSGTQLKRILGSKGSGRLVRDGLLVKLWRNAYALPSAATRAETRLQAADFTFGRPVTACLHTAAQLYGFDLTGDATTTHVLADHDWPNANAPIRTHRCSPVRAHARLGGRSVTDLAETVLRVASAEHNPATVLATLDRALFTTPVQPADLAGTVQDLHIRGIRLVRELLPLADGRAESPGESWLRWVCIEAGFPPPTPQVRVSLGPGLSYRLDLGWEARRVGCEYEGVEFHTGPALTRDRDRYNVLQRNGWLLQGVTGPMIWQRRTALVAQIGSMLAERPA